MGCQCTFVESSCGDRIMKREVQRLLWLIEFAEIPFLDMAEEIIGIG
jgi:hypothetical protein